MTYILAIDPGSIKCGFARFSKDGKLLDCGHSVASAKNRWERQLQILTPMEHNLRTAEIVISEEPMMQGKAAQAMHKFLGAMEFARKAEIEWVHPMTVRKAIAGSGKADKIEMALAAGAMMELESDQDLIAELIAKEEFDVTDAIAVGLYWFLKQKEKANGI